MVCCLTETSIWPPRTAREQRNFRFYGARKGRTMKRAIAAAMMLILIGCAEQSSDRGEVASQSEAVSIEERPTPPSSSGESSLSLRWSVGEGIIEQDPKAVLELWIENHEDESLDGSVSIEVIGLGTRRVLDLGSITVAPKSVATLRWAPSNSPLLPWGRPPVCMHVLPSSVKA